MKRHRSAVLFVVLMSLAGCDSAFEPEYTVADLRDAPDSARVGDIALSLDPVEVVRNPAPRPEGSELGAFIWVRSRSGSLLPADVTVTRVWVIHPKEGMYAPMPGSIYFETGRRTDDLFGEAIRINLRGGPRWPFFDRVRVVVEVESGGTVALIGRGDVRIDAVGQ